MPSIRRSHSYSPHSQHRSRGPDVGFGAKAIAVLLLVLLVAAPWPFGGVEMTLWLWPAPILGLVCWIWMLGRSSAPATVVPWATVPVVLALAFAAIQLAPLSGDLLAKLSPKALSLWRDSQSLIQPIESASAVSAPISLFPEGGRLEATWLALGLCVFVLSAQFLRTEFGMIGLFGATTLVGSAIAVFSIVQGAGYKGKLYWFFELSTRATPFGPFINRNHGGAFMNLCVAGAVGFLWHLTTPKETSEDSGRWSLESESFQTRLQNALRRLEGSHVLAFAAVVLIIGGLVSSLSRGAAASAAAGTAAAMLAGRLRRRNDSGGVPVGTYVAAFMLLAAAGSFVYLIGAEGKAFSRLSTLVNDSDSGQKSRARHWKDMLPAVQDFKAAGSGLGSYVHVHRLYTPNNHGFIFEHADNTYLEILVELGFVGGALVVLFILCCARTIFLVLRRDRTPVGQVFGVAAAYVLATQVLHHAVDFPLYSPANLLLFAAWMGAACGRADRIATGAREEGRDLRFVSLPIGRWRTTGALPTGLLLALGLWSWWEATVQESIAWTLRSHRRNPATEKTSLAQVDRWVQELDGLAKAYPNRSALRDQLGDRWIDRCRVMAKEAAMEGVKAAAKAKETAEKAKEAFATEKEIAEKEATRAAALKRTEEDVWNKTEIMVLYAQLFDAARMNQGAILEAARTSKPISENLPRAKEQFLEACELDPLFVGPRLKLATMPYLLESPKKREMLVEQAAALAPGDAEVMFRVGLLEFHADRRENVVPAWRKSLEVSQTWVRPIFNHSVGWLTLDRALDEVFPPDPLLLINVAEQLLDGPKQQAQRDRVFARILKILPQSTIPKADKAETAGRALIGRAEYKGLDEDTRVKNYEQAAKCFEEAGAADKNRPRVWSKLADCYEQLGKYTEASRAIGILVGLTPANSQNMQRALELRKKAASQLESSPSSPEKTAPKTKPSGI